MNFETVPDKTFEPLLPLEKHISLNASDFVLLIFHGVRATPIVFLACVLR